MRTLLAIIYAFVLGLAIYSNNLETYFACTFIGVAFGVLITINETIVKPNKKEL